MKNYLTTSLKSARSVLYLLVMLCIGSTSLLGQTVTISSPTVVDHCEAAGNTVTFAASATDSGGTAVPNTGVLWLWTGPNGFSSSMESPTLTLNSSTQSGTYTVTVSYFGGQTADDSVVLNVADAFTMECPEDYRVSADSNCDIILDESISISGLECPGTYTYCVKVDGVDVPNTPANGFALDVVTAGTIGSGTVNIDYEFTVSDFGDHDVDVVIKLDGATLPGGCTIPVEVVEGQSSIACNDDLNVTLDENCEAVISPDMMLEGDFCFEAFTLMIDGYTSGNEIVLDAPGTYVVTVSAGSGSCWGSITTEDKTVPTLECQDAVTVKCSVEDNINPGTRLTYQKVLNTAAGTAPAEDTLRIQYDLSGQTGSDGLIQTFELDFIATIGSVSDLELVFVSPDPDNNDGSTSTADRTMITIADLGSVNTPCPFSNLDVSFRDYAVLPYASLGDSILYCRSANNFAYLGAFRPFRSFGSFGGFEVAYDSSDADLVDDNANGTWTLMVINHGDTDVTGISTTLRATCQSAETIFGGSDVIEITGCGNNISTTYSDEQMNSDCVDPFTKIITRTWTLTNDDSGFSNSCTQTINIERWNLEDIIFPENHDGLAFPALSCQSFVNSNTGLNSSLVSADTIPLPVLTGSPRVPFGEMCDNFRVVYNDTKIRVCGEYGMKVLREWRILDWCDSNDTTVTQVIKVDQTSDIITTCPPFELVFATGSQCTGEAAIPTPIATPGPYSCATDITYTVGYLYDNDQDPNTVPPSNDGSFEQSSNIFDDNGDGIPDRISNLPIGRTWIRYFFTDECGNTGKITKEVDVIDETQPNPICIEFTIISLGADGCATLPAESIDNHSRDNCGTIVSYQIDDPRLPGGFSETLEYCCESDCVNGVRDVILRVTDDSGNSNTCSATVEIQNNFNAVITNRPTNSLTYSCTQGAQDISEIVSDLEEEFEITSNCNNSYDYEVTYSNNQPINEGDLFEPGTCGAGSQSVKWTITDRCGDVVGTHNLSMRFTQNLTGFNVTRWPLDVNLNNCDVSLDPENLSSTQNADYIRATTSNCSSNIAITHSDQVFEDVDDACFKILRTWTVIDWCIVNNGNLEDGRRTHVQVLRINDNTAPVISNQNDIVVPSDNGTCSFFLTEAEYPIEIPVTDNCTDVDDLIITLEIDGQQVNSLYNREYTATTGVTITAMDHCGNTNTGFFRIRVQDTVAPTPYCRGTVVTTPMPNGEAEIWTSDFDLGGTDNCDTNGLDVYFENNLTYTRFDCEEILNGVEQLFTLEMFYRDDSGNVNSCVVSVLVQDNDDVCPDTGSSRITGNVHTEEMQMVSQVNVEAMSMTMNQSAGSMMTQDDGNYGLPLAHGGDYQVTPNKEDSYLNGISTLDLVMIQRHILGIERFTSPYKVIAADTDNNGAINGIDLVTLRKLILGIVTELPNGQKSWRFPVESQNFMNEASPFPFSEVIDQYNLNEDQNNQNFVAVKVGDVNADAAVYLTGDDDTTNRSAGLNLQVEDMGLMAGSTVEIPVTATNMENIAGFQTTMSFNSEVMTFEGVTAEGLEVTEGNLGLHNVADGYITFSWNKMEGVTVEDNRTLFTLTFTVKEAGNLSEQLFLSSALTKSEAYTGDLEKLDLTLEYKGADLTDFVLYQNIPNPFADNTEIRFNLPAAAAVTFSVYDVNGRVLVNRTSDYEGGSHTIMLNRTELNSTGVMYYKLETPYGTASRKMVQIR